MWLVILVGVLIVVLLAGWVFANPRNSSSSGQRHSPSHGKAAPSDQPLIQIRDMLLKSPASEFGIQPVSTGEWGCLVETGLLNAAWTLVCLADGTTSLYFSNGGGIIGAGGNPQVAENTKEFIKFAASFRSKLVPAKRLSLPEMGCVRIYLLTTQGVFSVEASEEYFGNNRHPVSPVFHGAHQVISMIRLLSENNK